MKPNKENKHKFRGVVSRYVSELTGYMSIIEIHSNNELFGNERMLEALNSSVDVIPDTIVKTVKEKIDEFVGKAPQFDDITMLAIQML